MNLLTEKENSAGSEGASRASGDHAGREAMVADPEVSERPKRRRFTAEYKLRIVREADACKGDGDIVALLRREWFVLLTAFGVAPPTRRERQGRPGIEETGAEGKGRGPEAQGTRA